MRPYLAAALLLFVVSSVAYLIVTEVRSHPELSVSGDGAVMQKGPTGLLQPTTSPESAEETSSEVVVYYFHGKTRCKKCLAMEKYAKEAVAGIATRPDGRGVVAWRVIDYDDPAHEHFINDFGLTSSSVVVVRKSESSQAQFKILDKTWNLVSDEEAFKAYVVAETIAMLVPAS